MDHQEWIEKEFYPLAKSLGFCFTPGDEIEDRLVRLRKIMSSTNLESLLVVQKMDCYYLSGTTQDALLFIPLEGKPLLLVKRELKRAGMESPLETVVNLDSLRKLPALIEAHMGTLPETMGLEMDVLPVKDFFRYQSLFPQVTLLDSSSALREVRKIKSPHELDLMRKAGEIGRKVYEYGKNILKEGMTEIAFGGLLEAHAKTLGHEGLLRVRSMNYEAYSWHVLSGPHGGVVSQSDSPMGGMGLSPAFPVGAGFRVMSAHEPIMVDFGTCYQGYQADETRMFSIRKMKQKFMDAYKACREIHDAVLEQVRPGADCEALFRNTLKLAEALGYKESYLGPPGLQTRFVGHGIGLELNEFPFLAQGHSYPLEEGMTFALEPKIVFPGEGGVGVENTLAVTAQGYEILTPLSQEVIEVPTNC